MLKPLQPGIVVTDAFRAACCRVLSISPDQLTARDCIETARRRLPDIENEMAKAGAELKRYDGIEALDAYYAIITDTDWYVSYGPDDRPKLH